jgi:methyl-accepting chemotaxis protein
LFVLKKAIQWKPTRLRSFQMKTIRAKLMIAMVSLAVWISVLCGIANAAILYADTSDSMNTRVRENAAAYSSSVQNAIGNYKTKIEAIAQNSSISDINRSPDARKIMLQQMAMQYGFTSVMVCDYKGLTLDNTDESGAEFFKQALSGKTYLSSTFQNKDDNSTALLLATKLNNGGTKGVVYAYLSSDTFCKMISNVSVGKSGYGFIVDKSGKIIAHKDFGVVTRFTNYLELSQKDASYSGIASVVKHMTAQQKGTETVDFNGGEQCISYMPIADTDGWSIGVTAKTSELMSDFYRSLFLTLGLILLFIVISVFAAVRIGKPIADPIVRMVGRIQKLAEGDLHTEVPQIQSGDEIGILSNSLADTVGTLSSYVKEIAAVLTSLENGDCTVEPQLEYRGDFVEIRYALNAIIANLNRTFTQISQSAGQVSTGAEQVSDAAQELSQGASRQADSVERLSASLSNIVQKSNQAAENAADADRLSTEATKEVENGSNQMQKMTCAIDEIRITSDQIGKVIKTIEDIAFQTNILALNAAIEAARAGSAGKGFAVVADEVRNLAAKSAEAAKSTAQLIESSLRAVESGTKIVGETARSLNTIIASVGKTSQLVRGISEVSGGQAGAIREITQHVDRISAVVQTNSATSEQTAATSEELNGQAQTLKNTLAQIRLKPESETAG